MNHLKIRKIAKQILAQRGMDENMQGLYDGPDSHKRFDQIEVLENVNVIDEEAMLNELENNEYQRSLPQFTETDESPRRDPTEKYRGVDEKPFKERYWQERRMRP